MTVIERENRILPGWESEAGERVAQTLEAHGVTVLLNQNVSLDQIERDGGAVQIQLGERTVEGDLVLMATGRKPNSRGIGLGALGSSDGDFAEAGLVHRLIGVRQARVAIGAT